MIIHFKDFLNEDIGDEIRKRLSDRINKTIANIKDKYPKKEIVDERKPKKVQVQPEKSEKGRIKPELPRELKLKSIKVKGLDDKRLVDALTALRGMGFDEKTVLNFLKNIEEIYPETTTEDIIKFGMKHLSKF